MIEPIKPSDIPQAKARAIPEAVIQVVNDILARRFVSSGTRVIIKQKEIVDELVANHDMTKNHIYENGCLNFEELYRAQGWKVRYAGVSYYENYDSYFEFIAEKN